MTATSQPHPAARRHLHMRAAFLLLVIFGLTLAAQIAATVQAAYLEPDPYGVLADLGSRCSEPGLCSVKLCEASTRAHLGDHSGTMVALPMLV